MIKINLLDSVTERSRSVAAVEAQVANPRARAWMLGAAVAVLAVCGMGADWYSANTALANAQTDLKREEEIAARTAAINKEQAELEKKVKAIQTRIDAIKKLRASQRGPVSVLSALNQRLPSVADFRLDNVEQKGDSLTVEGNSPSEAAVTQFARSLEFSSGLFANVGIETERKSVEVKEEALKPNEVAVGPAPKPETVRFKITCRYTPPAPEPANAGAPGATPATAAAPSNQIAQKN